MPDSGLLITLQLTAPARLDQSLLIALQREAPTLSRAKLKTAINSGYVFYRGRPASASELLAPGTHEITLLGWSPQTQAASLCAASASSCFLPVIHEDEDLLVLHKITGVPSIPHQAVETHTAVSAALAHCPALASIGRGGFEPGLLHRLDTGTSGLLAFAKTQTEFDRITQAWRTEQVRKIYRAIAPLQTTPQTLRLEMGHDARSAKRMQVIESGKYRDIRGKSVQTVTHLRSAKLISLPAHSPGFADHEIEIETGAMHQIRCTLAHLGSPILGDPIYGGQPSTRLWLHAWRLLLPLKNGTRLWLEARLPENWPE